MRRNAFASVIAVVAVLAVSVGAAYAAGRTLGERQGADTAREETIAELQGQFQQALASLQQSEATGNPATGGSQEQPAFGGGGFQGAGGGAFGGGFPGDRALRGGGTVGRVVSLDGDRLTLATLQDGTVTVLLSGDTAIQRTVDGSRSDLRPESQVLVTGERQEDGTLRASQITLVPEGR